MEVIIKCSDDCRGGKNIYGEPIVEIVRCKECKHWSEKACHKFLATHPSDADDFCSYGEREGE